MTEGGEVNGQTRPVAAGLAASEQDVNKRTKDYKRPVWKSEEPMTLEDIKVSWYMERHCTMQSMHVLCSNPCLLQGKREVFWDTQPHYGGSRGERDMKAGLRRRMVDV